MSVVEENLTSEFSELLSEAQRWANTNPVKEKNEPIKTIEKLLLSKVTENIMKKFSLNDKKLDTLLTKLSEQKESAKRLKTEKMRRMSVNHASKIDDDEKFGCINLNEPAVSKMTKDEFEIYFARKLAEDELANPRESILKNIKPMSPIFSQASWASPHYEGKRRSIVGPVKKNPLEMETKVSPMSIQERQKPHSKQLTPPQPAKTQWKPFERRSTSNQTLRTPTVTGTRRSSSTQQLRTPNVTTPTVDLYSNKAYRLRMMKLEEKKAAEMRTPVDARLRSAQRRQPTPSMFKK